MHGDDLAALSRLLQAIRAAKVDGDAGEIFRTISEDLPSWLAKPVIEAE